jgi:hypothetical protein
MVDVSNEDHATSHVKDQTAYASKDDHGDRDGESDTCVHGA